MGQQARSDPAARAREGKRPGKARRHVLDVAAREFRAHGYAGVGMRAIAQAADLRAASLYHHFPSKDDLVVAVLDAGIAAVHESVEQAIASIDDGAPVAARIRAAMIAHLESLLAESDYTSANVRIYGQLPAPVRERHRQVRKAYEALWDRLIEEAAGDGALRRPDDPVLLRNVILGSLNASLEWFRPGRGGVRALAGRQADLLLHGVLSPGADGGPDGGGGAA